MGWERSAVDDVTGIRLAETEAAEVKYAVGDESGLLVISESTRAALAALLSGDTSQLRAIFAPAAPVSSGRTRRTARGSGNPSKTGEADEHGITPDTYRTWATEHGITVSARGRVPASVREAFHAANGGKPATAAPAAPESAETNAPASTDTSAATDTSAENGAESGAESGASAPATRRGARSSRSK